MAQIIFIKVMFGGIDHFCPKWQRKHPIYKDVMVDFNKDNLKDVFHHLVLGENNRDFLLSIGVPENKIILIDKRRNVEPEGAHALWNKTYLLNCAAEIFAGNDILCTDYDNNLIRDFNADDIHSVLESKNAIIQCPALYYKRGIFTSNGKKRQSYGLQTCLVYWKSPEIIKKWFDYQVKNPTMWGDEPPLLLALEEGYGTLSVEDLDRFDTSIIRTNHRPPECELFRAEKYKDAYFFHN